MDDAEQVVHFSNELDKLVDRFRNEYDITYAAIVGSLQMKVFLLCQEAKEAYEDPDAET